MCIRDRPYPVDAGWNQQLSRDTVDGTKFILTWTKSYDSYKLLENEIQKDTTWMRNLNRSIVIDKSFGFFYSYMRYKETYKAANPFDYLNYQDYLSKQDLVWLRGIKIPVTYTDSLAYEQAEDKSDAFMCRSFTAEVENILKRGIEKLKNPNIEAVLVDQYHDSLVKVVDDWQIGETQEFVDLLYGWTGEDVLLNIKETESSAFSDLDHKTEFFEKLIMMENYKNNVEMPGLITETNSLQINGNSVSWDVEGLNYFYDDFEMYVESRVVNNWAFIFTGIVVLLLLVMVVVRVFK